MFITPGAHRDSSAEDLIVVEEVFLIRCSSGRSSKFPAIVVGFVAAPP